MRPLNHYRYISEQKSVDTVDTLPARQALAGNQKVRFYAKRTRY
nr:MAG TPA: hypothetical protein [Caudoviricetes sp.]